MKASSAEKSSFRFVCRLIELLFRRLCSPAGHLELLNFLLAAHRPALPAPSPAEGPESIEHSGIKFLLPLGQGNENKEDIFRLVQQLGTQPFSSLVPYLERLQVAMAADWLNNWQRSRDLKATLILQVKVVAEQVGLGRGYRWKPSAVFRIRTHRGSEKFASAPH